MSSELLFLSDDESETSVTSTPNHAIREPVVLILGLYTTGIELAIQLVKRGIPTLSLFDNRKIRAKRLHYHTCFSRAWMGRPIQECVKAHLESLETGTRVEIVNNLKSKRFTHIIQTDVWKFRIREINDKHFQPRQLNLFCRQHHIFYYFALHFGYLGYLFSDKGAHGSTDGKSDMSMSQMLKSTFDTLKSEVVNLEEPITEDIFTTIQHYLNKQIVVREDILYSSYYPPVGYMLASVITQEILKWEYFHSRRHSDRWVIHKNSMQYMTQHCSCNYTSLLHLGDLYRSDPSKVIPKQLTAYLKKAKFAIFGCGTIALQILQHFHQLELCTHTLSKVEMVVVNKEEENSLLQKLEYFQTKTEPFILQPSTKIIKEGTVRTKFMYSLDREWWENNQFIISCGPSLEEHTLIAEQCFLYDVPLFDCGAEQSMGHVQIILPYITQQYQSLQNTSRHAPHSLIPKLSATEPTGPYDANAFFSQLSTRTFTAALMFSRILKHFTNIVYTERLKLPLRESFYNFSSSTFLSASPLKCHYNEWKKIDITRLRCAQNLHSILRKIRQVPSVQKILKLYYEGHLIYDHETKITENLKLCDIYFRFSIPCSNYLVLRGTYLSNNDQVLSLPLVKYSMN